MPLNPTIQYIDIPINNGTKPKTAKALSIACDFASQASYELDLTLNQFRGFERDIQTLFVDTTDCSGVTTIATINTFQTLRIPAGTQGYYPFLIPSPARFVITGSGGTLQMHVVNIPMPLGQWPTVSDFYEPNVKASTVSVSTVGPHFLVPALANQGWILTSLVASLTSDATLAVAGNLNVNVLDNVSGIFVGTAYVPAAAGAVTIPMLLNWSGKVFARALNTSLYFTLGTALTGGSLKMSWTWKRTKITSP